MAKARYKAQFTASRELRDKLAHLEALMPGADLEAITVSGSDAGLSR